MYQLVQNFNSLADLQAYVATIAAAMGGTVVSPPKDPPPAAGKAAKPAPASPSPSPAAPLPAATAPTPAATPVKQRSYEETGIGQMLKEVSIDAEKKTKAADLLKEFGAVKEDGKPSGGMLKPDQWDGFIARLKVIKEGATDDMS
jgi:hypothetical protein